MPIQSGATFSLTKLQLRPLRGATALAISATIEVVPPQHATKVSISFLCQPDILADALGIPVRDFLSIPATKIYLSDRVQRPGSPISMRISFESQPWSDPSEESDWGAKVLRATVVLETPTAGAFGTRLSSHPSPRSAAAMFDLLFMDMAASEVFNQNLNICNLQIVTQAEGGIDRSFAQPNVNVMFSRKRPVAPSAGLTSLIAAAKPSTI